MLFLTEKISELQDQINTLQAATGSGIITGQDGNSYTYLTYGDQVWTVENAEMVTYRDGTPIPEVTDQTEWSNLITGAWCYNDNDPTKPRLYNWYAVAGIHDTDPNTPNKEFAPEGWHVPSDDEWTSLEEYLIANGYNYDQTTTENKIAKAMASTLGWTADDNLGYPGYNQSTNNSSGFNAIPNGNRQSNGDFVNLSFKTGFWGSSEYSDSLGDLISIQRNFPSTLSYAANKPVGLSVRLVRDGEVDPDDIDNDGDGYTVNQGDCNDTNASINPGATEIQDGIDNDCDGDVD